MNYLLDTNVISELARKTPDPAVMEFVRAAKNICVSVIVFHELTYGVSSAEANLKARLTLFLNEMKARLGEDAIPIDLQIAEAAGELRAIAKLKGRILHPADALIAATAAIHGATLVTRNTKDFEGIDGGLFKLINPFSR